MRSLLIIVAFFLLPHLAIESRAQIASRIDSLAKVHQAKGFNGNVLYSRNDSILFTGHYGYRDFDTRQPLNDSSTFELASLTKQFTAVGIIQLEEKGKLSYSTPVVKILSDFPYPGITIKHLLRHQSGLPDEQLLFNNKTHWNGKKRATSQNMLELLSRLRIELAFEPGTQYRYSNTGYIVLAAVIEKLSGQTYSRYMRQHIFQPAGMSTAVVVTCDSDPEHFSNTAKGYTYNKRKKKHQTAYTDKSHKHLNWMRTMTGGAGIYASVLDLEQWKKALRFNKLISAESKVKMTSPDKTSVKYGFGVAIYLTESKGKWVYHTGSWGGAKTMMLYLPETNELIVILSNNRYANTYKTFDEELYRLLLD